VGGQDQRVAGGGQVGELVSMPLVRLSKTGVSKPEASKPELIVARMT
jgi:hypothetical protein